MTKPKGKTPSLLAQSTGKPTVYLCKRKTKCCRCKQSINSGDDCFRVPKLSAGFTNKKLYCLKCFRLILDQTKNDLTKIEEELVGFEKNF